MYCPRCGTWTPEGATACAQCGASLAPVAPPPGASATSWDQPATHATSSPPESGPDAAAVEPLLAVPVYGGFWRRAAASAVDGLVLFFPDAILRVLLDLPTLVTLRPVLESDVPRLMLVYAFETAVWWLYLASMESSAWQGTLGQQLMGLRVTTVAGARVSFARASARYFAQWLSVLICGMGYLFNLWTSRRQTLHDMVSGCVLVRRGLRQPVELAGGHAA